MVVGEGVTAFVVAPSTTNNITSTTMLNTLEIDTQRNQNVGRAVINKLTEMGLYGKVNIKTIHTERNCSTRTKHTVVQYN